MDKSEFERGKHSSVCLGNCVIIFGGLSRGEFGDEPLSTRVIWTYNLYTEEWRNYVIPDSKDAPEPFDTAVAAVINGTIYTFGGNDAKSYNFSNALWALGRTGKDFTWTFIKPKCKESPSPRTFHTGWEYAGNLWIFGGAGPSSQGYLNDHGEFDVIVMGSKSFSKNNQLLCFDPNTAKWINPQCHGDVPSPRSFPTSATIKNKVWIFGGITSTQYADDFFELSMHSLTWTQIQSGSVRPQARNLCTLTALTDNKLVLHGGNAEGQLLSDTWIIDLTSYSWRMFLSDRDHGRCCHTSASDLNNNVIIFGGMKDSYSTYEAYIAAYKLPIDVRSALTLSSFKVKLKTHLYKICYK